MNDQLPPKEILDSDLNPKNQIDDYEYLLIRLNDIKDNIAKLEKFFFK